MRRSLTLNGRATSDAKEITEKDVIAIDDFDDAFDYADELDVDLQGLDELEDMKERLLMHIRKGEHNPKQQIEYAMVHINKEDEHKRSKLTALLNETKETLAIFQMQTDANARGQRGSAAIEGLLKTEGATNDLALDFNSKLTSIKSGKCMVVVSGETSAGKSTVVNLLLQEDILPTHTLSCTSVVTKIAYGESRRAEIIYADKRTPPLQMNHLDKDNVLQQVIDAIFVRDIDDRERLSDVKEVKLFVPCDILKIFQQTIGIPMGTNCAPLLADLFLYSYEAEFIQSLLRSDKKTIAKSFNFTYRYIDDVLSLNNPKFGDYLEVIYPTELEVKDTTESINSASYLDLQLEYDIQGKLNLKLYDKRDDFNFPIVNFPFLSSNIPASPAYGVDTDYANSGIIEKVNDLKNGLQCIPNLTISGFIGDVHLVSHGKVFNEAPTCPLPQVTRRPLAMQHKQYCKSGLVFVDTPGIGENDAMDDVITKFVAENPIMGFIYVIKSDNAGGVQEDRLLGLIKIILEHQRRFHEGALPFDPKCAIFLCNLWDNVKVDEADEVYDNAVKKLGQCWPALTASQVIRLSAKKAKTELDIDPDYIKADYLQCLEGVKDIFQRAVDRRVKSAYKWIENILIRSTHHLKSLVKRIDTSERDLEDKMKEVFEKLQRLRKRSDEVIVNMNERIKEASEDICNDFREYLRSPASRVAITQWIEDELPSKEQCKSWDEVKDAIDLSISKRIAEQLEKWEQATQKVKTLENQVVMEMKINLHLIQDDLKEVEDYIQADDDKSTSSEDEFPVTYRKDRRKSSLGGLRQSVFNLNAPDIPIIPIKLITRVQHPVKFVRNIRKSFNEMLMVKKLKTYQNNPCKAAKNRAEKKLNSLLDDITGRDVLALFVDGLLDRPKLYVQTLEENIPALIQSNEDLMNHIAMCRVDAVDSRSLYERMMEDMEKVRNNLIEYGQGYIFVDDFMGEEISVSEDIGIGGSGTTFRVSDLILDSSSRKEATKRGSPRGLWTALQNGFVTKDGIEKNVSMKIYLPSAGIEQAFPEVARLRCLHNAYVAEFLGVHHSDSPIQAFVYENHVKSLRQFLRSGFGRLKDDLPRIIIDISTGLEYLHRKRMVHMELNTNTITITATGEVKLTGGCLPRNAAFPLDREAIEVGDFVYLAPEVLNDELYIACADIYAMSLLLFELFVERPFSNQLRCPLDQFSSKVNPSEMLSLESNLADFSDSMKDLITRCLDTNPDNRPATEKFVEGVQEIKNETIILSKFSNRKSNQCVRKQRSNPLSGR